MCKNIISFGVLSLICGILQLGCARTGVSDGRDIAQAVFDHLPAATTNYLARGLAPEICEYLAKGSSSPEDKSSTLELWILNELAPHDSTINVRHAWRRIAGNAIQGPVSISSKLHTLNIGGLGRLIIDPPLTGHSVVVLFQQLPTLDGSRPDETQGLVYIFTSSQSASASQTSEISNTQGSAPILKCAIDFQIYESRDQYAHDLDCIFAYGSWSPSPEIWTLRKANGKLSVTDITTFSVYLPMGNTTTPGITPHSKESRRYYYEDIFRPH